MAPVEPAAPSPAYSARPQRPHKGRDPISSTGRASVFAYGISCYAIFFVTFLYLIGWLTGRLVPTSIDSGAAGNTPAALAVDLALIALFGVQHSVMARPGFKRWWTRVVPQPIERATYVLATSLVLIALFAAWQSHSRPARCSASGSCSTRPS